MLPDPIRKDCAAFGSFCTVELLDGLLDEVDAVKRQPLFQVGGQDEAMSDRSLVFKGKTFFRNFKTFRLRRKTQRQNCLDAILAHLDARCAKSEIRKAKFGAEPAFHVRVEEGRVAAALVPKSESTPLFLDELVNLHLLGSRSSCRRCDGRGSLRSIVGSGASSTHRDVGFPLRFDRVSDGVDGHVLIFIDDDLGAVAELRVELFTERKNDLSMPGVLNLSDDGGNFELEAEGSVGRRAGNDVHQRVSVRDDVLQDDGEQHLVFLPIGWGRDQRGQVHGEHTKVANEKSFDG